jgi:protein-S-isoprenylcysteine O-methyltransferase Ste14
MKAFLARYRVALGFACGAVAFWLAAPTPRSLAAGFLVALAGEALRIWAAGHIEKGSEITTSGPYRLVRHPLYLGSSIMGAGFAIAAQSVPVALLVATYFAFTITAAIRTEEAVLDARFPGGYAAYRAGALATASRRFSLARAIANREYRTVAGLAAGIALLWLRMRAT